MDTIRGRIILGLLSTFPIFAYVSVQYLHADANHLSGLIIYALLFELIFTKFRLDENLRIPKYLTLLAFFTLYLFIVKIFVSDIVANEGLFKYLYHDNFLRATAALLIIENTRFDKQAINYSLKFLFWVLIAAAIVSVIQINDPLFFRNGGWLDSGFGSFEAYEQYLKSLGPYYYDDVTPIHEGYRYSIYSWVSGVSVGMDALAIFSILLAMKSLPRIKRYLLILASGLVSILSSSRWIMLNFIAIFSQRFIGRKSSFIYAFKLVAALVTFGLLITISASVLGIDLNKFFQERLLSDSANTRFYAFEVFGKVFPDNPIFGTGGADTEKMLALIQGKTSQIHVGWLKLLYYYGLVGGIMYVIFLISLLQHLYRRAVESSYWGSFFALLAFTIANFTLVELSIFYHGLLLAVLYSRYLSNVEEIAPSEISGSKSRPVVYQKELAFGE
ncbi:MAG: O-antigen ligase family protein [Saprospiraceae bacterium]|nr:O-antigen ligase family protein [Saprospiraceae bacterium]